MRLTTDRLILREIDERDWPAVLAYQSDPRSLRYYTWTGGRRRRTPEAVQEFVGWFLADQAQTPRTKFQPGVTLKSSGELIGNCGVRMESAGAVEADIGYELAPGHWGRGYATEAARAIVQFGFTELRVHRIWAGCVADNAAPAHVLEKLGLRREGRLREKEYYKGRWRDTLMYAILEDEWRALQ